MNENKTKLKTSKEWWDSIPVEVGLKILDPDGWDRQNFQYSFYEELITYSIFMSRLQSSTIQCKIGFNKLLEL
jgi:hypothetical protein